MRKIKGITVIEVIVIISIVLVLGVIIIEPIVLRTTKHNARITVTDKDTKRSGDTDKYLIYTKEGTYEITDTIAFWRFDSSDLYGKIEIGKTYDCEVAGWRVPFLSAYENIITAEEVS